MLVSSPRAEAIDEASHLASALRDSAFPLRAIVVNLVHPAPLPLGIDPPVVGTPGPLTELFDLHHQMSMLAADEAAEIGTLRELGGGVPIIEVPMLDDDIHDLAGLAVLGRMVLDPT